MSVPSHLQLATVHSTLPAGWLVLPAELYTELRMHWLAVLFEILGC